VDCISRGGAVGRRPRRLLPRAAGALALLALAGCAGPGLGARYRALEEDWRRSAAGPLASSATPGAGEDPFAGAGSLVREDLVGEVLRRNPSLHAARHAWRAALARYPQATSLDDPMLGLSAAPRSFDSRAVNDAWRVDVGQAFPFPGKLALRGEIALAEAEATADDFEAVRLRLAAMASLLHDDLYVAARAVEINAQHVALVEELHGIALARYEAGEGSANDPLQAEVELAHILHDDISLRTAERVAREQINALLHRRPDAPLPPPPPALELPPLDGADRAARLEAALAEQPELRAAEARIRSKEAAVALARREFLPDVTLMAAYDRIWQERELQPMVGLQVNVPLRLARRRAALDEARAELERAKSERASVEDDVLLGVASGLDRFAEAHHIHELYRDRLLPATRDQVEAARAAFETGRTSFLAVIDAERNLRRVELGYEQALADASRRHAELERASGRLAGQR